MLDVEDFVTLFDEGETPDLVQLQAGKASDYFVNAEELAGSEEDEK